MAAIPGTDYQRIARYRNRLAEIVMVCAIAKAKLSLLSPGTGGPSEDISRTKFVIPVRSNYRRITGYRNRVAKTVTSYLVACQKLSCWLQWPSLRVNTYAAPE